MKQDFEKSLVGGEGGGEKKEASHQNSLKTLSPEAGLKWGTEGRPIRLPGLQLKKKSSAALGQENFMCCPSGKVEPLLKPHHHFFVFFLKAVS